MRIDLHTHSPPAMAPTPRPTWSAPRTAAGLDVVALTDHDAMRAGRRPRQAADEVGITLVRRTGDQHEPPPAAACTSWPTSPTRPTRRSVAALDRILAGRTDRTPAIVDALRAHGIEITEDDVRRESGGSVAAGRPHVADALVRLGVVTDRTHAFTLLLNPGRPGYVNRYAADLTAMIPLVVAAGGVAVLAHPWGRSGRSVLDAEALESLRGVGLAGIEVDHQDHDAATRATLRGLAADLDLVATGSSDHHGLGKVDHELGVNTTPPEEFERLVHLAADAARASGRTTPGACSSA